MLKQRNDNRAPGTKKVHYHNGRMHHPQAVNAYSHKERCSKSLAALPSPDVPGCKFFFIRAAQVVGVWCTPALGILIGSNVLRAASRRTCCCAEQCGEAGGGGYSDERDADGPRHAEGAAGSHIRAVPVGTPPAARGRRRARGGAAERLLLRLRFQHPPPGPVVSAATSQSFGNPKISPLLSSTQTCLAQQSSAQP